MQAILRVYQNIDFATEDINVESVSRESLWQQWDGRQS